jgi:hypothetical protein
LQSAKAKPVQVNLEKSTKIILFLPGFAGKKLFIIYTKMQGNPVHILLLLPINLF